MDILRSQSLPCIDNGSIQSMQNENEYYSSDPILQLGKKAGFLAKQMGALPTVVKASCEIDNKTNPSLFIIDPSSYNNDLGGERKQEIKVSNKRTIPCSTIYTVILALSTREDVFDDSKDHDDLDSYSNEMKNSVYSFEGIETMYKLDTKQKNAFRIIASSVVMRILQEQPDSETILNDILPNENVNIKTWLQSFGADPNLIMLLAGQAGSGKSYTLSACIKFTENLYRAIGLVFGPDVFKVTAMTLSLIHI